MNDNQFTAEMVSRERGIFFPQFGIRAEGVEGTLKFVERHVVSPALAFYIASNGTHFYVLPTWQVGVLLTPFDTIDEARACRNFSEISPIPTDILGIEWNGQSEDYLFS
jgi:hypothetical protein